MNYTNNEKTLLAKLRERKGVTQMEMAKVLGIAYQTYREYEKGNFMKMSAEREQIISEYFNTEYKYTRR